MKRKIFLFFPFLFFIFVISCSTQCPNRECYCNSKTNKTENQKIFNDPRYYPVNVSVTVAGFTLSYSYEKAKRFQGARKFHVAFYWNDHNSDVSTPECQPLSSYEDLVATNPNYLISFPLHSTEAVRNIYMLDQQLFDLNFYVEMGDGTLKCIFKKSIAYFIPFFLKPVYISSGKSVMLYWNGAFNSSGKALSVGSEDEWLEPFADTDIDDIGEVVYQGLVTVDTWKFKNVIQPVCYKAFSGWICKIDEKHKFSIPKFALLPEKVLPVDYIEDDEKKLKVWILSYDHTLREYVATISGESLKVTSSVVDAPVWDISKRGYLNKSGFYFAYVSGSTKQYIRMFDYDLHPVPDGLNYVNVPVKNLLDIYTDKDFSPQDYCYLGEDNGIYCGFDNVKFKLDYKFKLKKGYLYYRWGHNPYVFSLISEDGKLYLYVQGGMRGHPDGFVWIEGHPIMDKICCSGLLLVGTQGHTYLNSVIDLSDDKDLFFLNEENFVTALDTFSPVVLNGGKTLYYYNGFYYEDPMPPLCGDHSYLTYGVSFTEITIRAEKNY